MYISKVYLSDNFVPDLSVDQFRRRVAGYEVTLSEGEDYKEAERMADEKIAEYIKANKTESMMGTEVVVISQKNIPDDMQIDLDGINNCKTPEELKSFWLISKGNLVLSQAYKAKEKQLTNA